MDMNSLTRKNSRIFFNNLLSTLLLFSLGGSLAFAHSDFDKARFVATTGADQGRCDNRFRPCKTIAYATRQANKGDVVMVAAGQYSIRSVQALNDLIGQIVPVRGGYSAKDHFAVQHPSANQTLLKGVPRAYQAALFDQGFIMINDGKSQLDDEALALSEQAQAALNTRQTQQDCVNGQAGSFTCSNISLLAHLPLKDLLSGATRANDIWGHVDLNTGREYAIIGLRNGVAAVDVSDPTLPRVVGSYTGNGTTWRDIKVLQRYNASTMRWQAWAYVTADNTTEGLVIFDLNNLQNGLTVAARDSTDTRAHNIYISGVDYSLNIANSAVAPQAHILGGNNFGGALRSYGLANPVAPSASYVPSTLGQPDYAHDASSMTVSDERAARDCPNANAGRCEVLLDFNEESLRLWDNTSQNSASQLSDTAYPNARYTHSGWWSEDRRYVFVHDELDEQGMGTNTSLYVFDVSSLTNPELVATWIGSTTAIDHNGYVRGNRYYMSNYTRGLTVLDISNPRAPAEAGFFDTAPEGDVAVFSGAWGVYPYLPSGIVLVSDIQRGLFIFRDETLGSETSLGFDAQKIVVSEGGTASLRVTRNGEGAASVSYSILRGSTSVDDIVASDGELVWAADDADTKTLTIPINVDSTDQSEETFFVSLHTPQDAFLRPAGRLASVAIAANADFAGAVAFFSTNLSLRENQSAVEISITRSGGSRGELRVPLSFSDSDATDDLTISPAEVVWGDGDAATQRIRISPVDDTETEATETYTLTAGAASINITLRDDESNQPPVANAGDDSTVNARASVALPGTASDPENGPLTLRWNQTEGPMVTLSDTASASPEFTAPNEEATLRFTLTVTDEFGVSASDEIVIRVAAPAPAQPLTSSGGGGGAMYPLTLAALLILSLLKRGVSFGQAISFRQKINS